MRFKLDLRRDLVSSCFSSRSCREFLFVVVFAPPMRVMADAGLGWIFMLSFLGLGFVVRHSSVLPVPPTPRSDSLGDIDAEGAGFLTNLIGSFLKEEEFKDATPYKLGLGPRSPAFTERRPVL